MTIWDEVKRSVDDISDVAKEVANLLAEKTDELSREGKLKLEKFNLQRQMRGLQTRLGRRTYHLWSEKPKSAVEKDEEASRYLNTLKGLTEKIVALDEEIRKSGAAEDESGEEGKTEGEK